MRIGVVLLPELDWDQDQERWKRADEYGFDHAWIFDHLAWRTLADGPWHATIPTLTAAALATKRIHLGTLVATPNFRHPVVLAKDLMTLDVISRGRLNVGLGAGADGFDASVLGQLPLSAPDRHARFAEFCQMLDVLLSHEVTTRPGEWYQAHGARMSPGPAQRPRPPVLIGANGPKAMRLAALQVRVPGDGWVTMGPRESEISDDMWWSGIDRNVRAMTQVCEQVESEVGSPVPEFDRLLHLGARTRSMQTIDGYEDQLGRAHELGFTDVVIPWPRPSDPYQGDEVVLDDLATRLPRLRNEVSA